MKIFGYPIAILEIQYLANVMINKLIIKNHICVNELVISRRLATGNHKLKGNTDMDWGLYKYRHLVENACARLKQYRAVATCHDKLKRNFESRVTMSCGYL